MKTCPYCAEEIQDAAIKCRHCGSMLEGDAGQPSSGGRGGAAMVQVPAPASAIFTGKPSWKGQFWSVLLGVLLCLSALAGGPALHLFAAVPWDTALIGAAVALVLGVTWLLVLWGGRATLLYHVTTRSLDIESGLLSKNIETLQLWKVRDIEFQQTVTDRLLGVSRVRIVTHDVTTPDIALWGLPGSRVVFEHLKDAIEIARQSRNVIGVVE